MFRVGGAEGRAEGADDDGEPLGLDEEDGEDARPALEEDDGAAEEARAPEDAADDAADEDEEDDEDDGAASES